MKILVTRQLPTHRTADLIDHYDEVRITELDRPLNESEFKEECKDVHAVICMLTDKINAESLGSEVRCVISNSVGYDHVDTSYLKSQNISFSHTPDVLTDATADLTWALILATARRVTDGAMDVFHHGFKGWAPSGFVGQKVSGGILGIVGLGRIGFNVAIRAMGFGMKILYHSPRPLPAQEEEALCAKRVSLEELLSLSDIVTLHCPLNENTHGMIGKHQLSLMKEKGILINTARGAVVDEVALLEHLENHPQFRVGLDVYWQEPLIPKSLKTHPRAVCLPHIGSADEPTRKNMADICIDEAIRFAKGEELQYEIKS